MGSYKEIRQGRDFSASLSAVTPVRLGGYKQCFARQFLVLKTKIHDNFIHLNSGNGMIAKLRINHRIDNQFISMLLKLPF